MIGNTNTAIESFRGVFDGMNFDISNLTGCFFSEIQSEGEVKNLGLVDVSTNGSSLCSRNVGTINNCYGIGTVTGSGGLCQTNSSSGTITNCHWSGEVEGGRNVGGLVGINRGTIANCSSSGIVSGHDYIGGLVGTNYTTITTSYSVGSVEGGRDVGGLVGEHKSGGISNCYSMASVKGSQEVGGLVGHANSNITNCYSTGSVSGTNSVGGLVGYEYYHHNTINSYWDVETSELLHSDRGTGLTTSEMQIANTYISWGCKPVWTIDEGNDYPRLVWENAPGDLIPTISYGGGNGDPNTPYLIFTADQLNTIGLIPCQFDKHFKLMADIDLSGYDGKNGRPKFNVIGHDVESKWRGHQGAKFTGIFDGNNHIISNFIYDSTYEPDIGFFGHVSGENAEIKNLIMIAPFVQGETVGSLVGRIEGGTISNCRIEGGSVSGEHAGGLAGYSNGAINNCFCNNSVTGDNVVGGIVGSNHYNGKIISSYSVGSITGNAHVGGLVGDNNDGTISNCFSDCSIIGDEDVGGLIGSNRGGNISTCFSIGNVTGNHAVGGFVGKNQDNGTIEDCYSKADVAGTDSVGGLVGWDQGGLIRHCYSVGKVEGTANTGGLIGQSSSSVVVVSFWDIMNSEQIVSAGGIGMTTEEMYKQDTFISWRCGSLWTIDEGNDYPRLVWENAPGDLIIASVNLYGGGTGTKSDPYLINTAEQLNTIGLITCDWDKCFKLRADINLSNYTETSFNIIGNHYNGFSGVFDGNGHSISFFTYKSNGKDTIGLFRYLGGPDAEIKNLTLREPFVEGDTSVGALVGSMNGTMANCSVKGGSVVGEKIVGGLVGNNHGIITQCTSSASVSGGEKIGGLVGQNTEIITNCCATGNVAGEIKVGGLAGSNYSSPSWNPRSRILTSYYKGSVIGNDYIGGLVGINDGWVADCYSQGSVYGDNIVGGLVGQNFVYYCNWGECDYSYGTITNCYSAATVSGNISLGGLVGSTQSGSTVNNSYWDVEVSGQIDSEGGIGKTSSEMQTATTFGYRWNFAEIWNIEEGEGYPYLWWELPFVDAGTDQTYFNVIPSNIILTSIAYLPSGLLGDFQWSQVSGPPIMLENPDNSVSSFVPTEFGTYVFEVMVKTEEEEYRDITSISIEIKADAGVDQYYYNVIPEIVHLKCESPTDELFYQWVQVSGPTVMLDNASNPTASFSPDINGEYIFELTVSNGSIEDVDSVSVFVRDIYGGGLGTAENPYQIWTAEDMQALGANPDDWDKYFILVDDIDLSQYDGIDGREKFNVIGSIESFLGFSGVFDGGGNKILNFICKSDTQDAALFGFVWGGSIKNLGLINPYVTQSGTYDLAASSLVGYLEDGVLSNCYVEGGSVTGVEYVGGLVGLIGAGTISNCYATCNVNGNEYVGGLIGYNYAGTIRHCYSTGFIIGNSSFGGFCGSQEDDGAEIIECFWDVETSGQTTSTGGTGLPTEEMKKILTFTDAGWDFTNETTNGTADIWRMCLDGTTYPRLAWEFGSDYSCPDGVSIEDLLYLSSYWLASDLEPYTSADRTGDGVVNIMDYALLADEWMSGM